MCSDSVLSTAVIIIFLGIRLIYFLLHEHNAQIDQKYHTLPARLQKSNLKVTAHHDGDLMFVRLSGTFM